MLLEEQVLSLERCPRTLADSPRQSEQSMYQTASPSVLVFKQEARSCSRPITKVSLPDLRIQTACHTEARKC